MVATPHNKEELVLEHVQTVDKIYEPIRKFDYIKRNIMNMNQTMRRTYYEKGDAVSVIQHLKLEMIIAGQGLIEKGICASNTVYLQCFLK